MIQKREGIWSLFVRKLKKSKPVKKHYKVKMNPPRMKLLLSLHKDRMQMKKHPK